MPPSGGGAAANVAILGHSHDGKTTLAEALLFASGASSRLGSTDLGTALLDYEPEEQRRHMSIQAGIAHLGWREQELTLLDAPGYQDFEGEVHQVLSVASSALIAVAATGGGGLSMGTETAWALCGRTSLPRIVVLTKLDKEHADVETTVAALSALTPRPLLLQLPIGQEHDFKGVVDVLSRRAFLFRAQGETAEAACPPELEEQLSSSRQELVEAICETDDGLLERYLDGVEPEPEQLMTALRAAVLSTRLVPVVLTSAIQGWGAPQLLDMVSSCLVPDAPASEPAAEPSLFIFKTVADPFGKISYFQVVSGELRPDAHLTDLRSGEVERIARPQRPRGKQLDPCDRLVAGEIGAATKLLHVMTGDTLGPKGSQPHPPIEYPTVFYTMAIRPKAKGDEEKLHTGLAHLLEEDPTLSLERDPETHENLIHGLGDVHLEVTLEKLHRKFQADGVLEVPHIPYHEAVRGQSRQQHRYKKQSGGAGLFGDCTLEIEPLGRGEGFVFEDRIFGGAIPQQFRPSVEKGVRQALEQGVLAGYPMVDLRVRLVDGSTHPVDGKDIAFQLAGAMAFREAVEKAAPYLLEPVMEVEVAVPAQFMGEVIGHLNAHRARIGQIEPLDGAWERVSARVPLAEMYRFPIELRSTTRGRGHYSMRFSHYEEVPPPVAQPIIEARRELSHLQREMAG